MPGQPNRTGPGFAPGRRVRSPPGGPEGLPGAVPLFRPGRSESGNAVPAVLAHEARTSRRPGVPTRGRRTAGRRRPRARLIDSAPALLFSRRTRQRCYSVCRCPVPSGTRAQCGVAGLGRMTGPTVRHALFASRGWVTMAGKRGRFGLHPGSRIRFVTAPGVRDAWPGRQNGTRLRAGRWVRSRRAAPRDYRAQSCFERGGRTGSEFPALTNPSQREARCANLARSRAAAKFRHRPRREGCLASPIEGDSASCRADGFTEARRAATGDYQAQSPHYFRAGGGSVLRRTPWPSSPVSAWRIISSTRARPPLTR